jgi:thymidylate kinase
MNIPKKGTSSRGLWIALLGPDGVGKSAVIEQLQSQLLPGAGDITLFHFRPGFHKRAVEGPPVTCPHAQRPRSLLVSFGKLIYWLVDCWYGYLAVIRPRKQRDGLVIFDRYYPDILVDPLRYRLPTHSHAFAQWITKLAPRPDLYLLLDAPAEVVQQRKSELTLSELQRQRVAYLKMSEQMHSKLLVSANCPVDEVVRHICTAIRNFYPDLSVTKLESSLLAGL